MFKKIILSFFLLLFFQLCLNIETANSAIKIELKIDSVLALSGESSVEIPVYFSNYSDTIAGFEIWIQLDRPDIALFNTSNPPLLRIDTSGSLISDWEYVSSNSLSGQNLDVNIIGLANLVPPPDDQFSSILPQTGGLLLTLVLDLFEIPDSTTDRILNLFITDAAADNFSFADLHGNSILVTDMAIDPSLFVTQDGALIVNCCYNPGDFNRDGEVNITDLTEVVKYMFKTGSSPPCMNEIDLDNNCAVNIADLTYRVKWMFKSGADPICGCQSF